MAQDFTVGSDGGSYDYSSLVTAVNAVTQTDSIIRIQGTWAADDTGGFTIDGGDGLTIQGEGSAKTNGVRHSETGGNSDAWRLADEDSGAGLIDIENNVTFKFLEISLNGTGTSSELFRFGASKTLTFDSMLVYAEFSIDQQDCIYTDGNDVTVNATNVVAANWERAFVDEYQDGDLTVNLNCCTFFDMGGNSGGGRHGTVGTNGTGTKTVNALNCIHAHDSPETTWVWNLSGTSELNTDYNIYSSGTVDDDTGVDTWNNGTDTNGADPTDGTPASGEIAFEDITGVPGQDFRLQDEANNVALDFCQVTTGANSGLTLPTNDIAGNARGTGTNGYYDCGAFAVNLASGGATDLLIADAAHAHSAEGADLTQQHILTVQDAAHSHQSDGLTLTQLHQLAIAEALHGHAADNLAISQAHALIIAGADHAHTADSLALTQSHSLATDSAEHAHSGESIALTQQHALSVGDALHSHAADSVVLSPAGSLIVQEALHGHLADNVTLSQLHQLLIADALHGQAADSLNLSQLHQLSIQGALHAHSADNAVLSIASALAIADALHGHTSESINLSQAHSLIIQAALHAHTAEAVALTQQHVLIIDDALHALLADVVTLTDSSIETAASRVIAVGLENRTVIVSGNTRTITPLNESRTIPAGES